MSRRAALVCALLASAACVRSDSTIQQDIEAALAADPATVGLPLTITARNGVVRVSGETRTEQEQDRVVEIVRSVDGVQEIVSEMRVGEAGMIARVRSALAADPALASVPITVEWHDGVIRLVSTQTNGEQRKRALDVARQVNGVTAVEDWMK